MDFVVEKATELGVKRLVPFRSAHTTATIPPDRQTERLARWRRIAQSAAKQSGSYAPRIDPPQAFTTLLPTLAAETLTILFHEQEQTNTLKKFAQRQPCLSSLNIIIGSEGGFSSQEVEQARTAGVQIVGLGTRILRAETAGIVASALCQFLWSD
jgi:16S rRNA (uracil1498-N3)-methyltransferase